MKNTMKFALNDDMEALEQNLTFASRFRASEVVPYHPKSGKKAREYLQRRFLIARVRFVLQSGRNEKYIWMIWVRIDLCADWSPVPLHLDACAGFQIITKKP